MKPTAIFTCLAFCLSLYFLLPEASHGQLERERVDTGEPIDFVFWAPSNIGVTTVLNMPSGNLNSSVLHTFGLVEGGIDRFYGLDDGANTRIGLEYGFHDRFSMGVGRMTFNNIVDLNSKYNILRQTEDGNTPIELAVKASVGINTMSDRGFDFGDRMSYFTSLMIARKFNGLSLQLSPMIAHFSHAPAHFLPAGGETPDQLFGLGVVAFYELNDRFALSAEYLPVLGDRNPGTEDAMGVALNIETGGHVFQVFLTSSQWHNEQYIMANNRHKFWEGEFRFGFNIHRVFGLR